MKMAMTALAVVFLAQAAPALAQRGERDRAESEDRPSRAETNHDRPQRDGGGGRREGRDGDRTPEAPRVQDAPRAVEAPTAAEPPRAAEPRSQDRARVPGDSIGRPGPWVQNGRGQPANDGARDRRRDGDRGGGNGAGGDRRDGSRGDGNRNDNDRGANGHNGNDRNGNYGRDWNRNGNDRHDWDRRDWDRHDWDRRHQGDRRDHHRWERGRYPSVYFSTQRYRHAWRAPVGYYARVWSFGDFLPRGWYGPRYYLSDPWNYDLPLAPPGYDWVRVGYDALLIDQYNGRVVQVVRNVVW